MRRTTVIALAVTLLTAIPTAGTLLIDGSDPVSIVAGAPVAEVAATTSTSTAPTGGRSTGTVPIVVLEASPPEAPTDSAPPSDATAPASMPATTTAGAPVVHATPPGPTVPAPAVDDAPASPPVEVHDDLPGAGTAPPPDPGDDPIGGFGDDGPVPPGLDLAALPKKPKVTNGLGGPGGLAVEASCATQCITRGVAYPRGFGAEIVVETSVPAELYISIVADLDHNGSYEDIHVETTPAGVTQHSWKVDHLEPGTTYYGMVAATDEHAHTSYAWGEFTTRSTRRVFVELGDGQIVGGPGNITSTRWQMGLDGPLADVTPGQQGILLYPDLPRFVDVDFWVLRYWDDKLCETWTLGDWAPPSHGHDNGSCIAWNSTSIDDLDLDQAPVGQTHWTQTSVTVPLRPAAGNGDLPPGYGDPYWFAFDIPLTLHVSYTA